ncbi:MAG: RidA family protein [Pirellulaceae bacterium]|nr:RidA family protein [Pirellulaceae bacterium]
MNARLFAVTLCLGCVLAFTGCSGVQDQTGNDREPSGAAGQPQPVSPPVAPPVAPAIRHLGAADSPGSTRAVVVEGYPLVHTRQILPLDSKGQLVGQEAVEKQIEQVLDNLTAVLQSAGSGLDRLVRLNVYADSPETVALARERLNERIQAEVRPVITAVQSPLPLPAALIAMDAVGTTDGKTETVTLQRCEAVAGDPDCADFAVLPVGGVAYLSGHPDKSPTAAEATAKSMNALLQIVEQLGLDRSHIVHLKVFVQPAQSADPVLRELKTVFPQRLTPPFTIVEWIASAPVEIEMIVHRPVTGEANAEAVSYYTPPGVKPSPTFSRVAVVPAGRQIYIAGLTSRAAGDGEAQVRDVFDQLQQILPEADSDLRHLVKATYYVSDDDASTKLNDLRPEFYDPQRPPAASKATVHGVGVADRTLGIDMIAVGKK